MILYNNTTRCNAIVTLKVNSLADLKTGVKAGPALALMPHEVTLGYVDILVNAGDLLDVADDADVVFVGVRSIA